MTSARTEPAPEIGVIGGSGFYSLLTDATAVTVETPYGEPSAPVTVGELAGRRVAFLPRHGTDHRFPPHRVPYRANIWALRSLGVRQLLTASAVGSLLAEWGPGTIALPDQILDRTWGRAHTYHLDSDAGVAHVSLADPYHAAGRQAALRASESTGIEVQDGATLVVINGPRFSTRAESHDYQRSGAHLIGMTAMPETALARELALPLTSLCLVTDHDAGVDVGHGVTHAEVLEQFAANLPRLRELLVATVAELPEVDPEAAYVDVYGDNPPPYQLP